MKVNHVVEVGSKIICVVLLIFQGVMVNAYLSKLYGPTWWSWIVADITVIIIWTSCLVIVWKGFSRRNKDYSHDPNEIKYTYIAWLVYVALLCPRIVFLFHDLVKTLDEKDVLGPNFLKMAVSCTPIIYFLLVYGSHTSRSHTAKHLSVQGIAAAGALDLFDSIDLLEFLFLPEEGIKFPRGYLHASLTFACVSFFMPVLSLYGLRYKALPGRLSSVSFKIIYEVLNLLIINLPNLIIRSVLWHKYDMDVSVLLMKNVMGIIAGSYEIFEYFGEYRPIKCKICEDWFERSAYSEHKVTCGGTEGVPMSPIFKESAGLTALEI